MSLSFFQKMRKKTNIEIRYDEVISPGIEAFKRNMRNMIYVARGNGIDVILSTYAMSLNRKNLVERPEKFKNLWGYVPDLTYEGMLDAKLKYNQTIRDVAKEEGVMLVDNAELIPESFEYYYDHCHLNDKGMNLMAKNSADAIERSLLAQKIAKVNSSQ